MKQWKANLDKDFLLKHMGSVSQLAGVKRYEFTDGRAKGVEAVDVVTGSGFDFTVMPGRCLDLAWARYRGIPIAYMSKADIAAPAYAEKDGMEWLRSFCAGLLTTCGFSNVGGPAEEERRIFGMQQHGLHGRLANLPAYDVCCSGDWTEDGYVMKVSGKIRQSAVHGENLVLTRTITSKLGEKKLVIHDMIENEGHVDEPLMLLYHMNFGYPLLDANSRLVTNSYGIRGADPTAEAELELCKQFHEPMHLRDERCYFHDLSCDENGMTEMALINDGLDLGVALRFSVKELPCLTEWKMLSEGEYVVGLEPGNTNPIGRLAAKERGTLEYIAPGEKKEVTIEMTILDGADEILAEENTINALCGRKA